MLLSESFKSRGYEVLEASDGAGLKAAFAGPQPDVALIDLKLPDADGLELLTALKTQWPDTEAIVLTGYATVDTAIRAFDLETGKEIWKGALPASAQATPMTYEWQGRQYVVICAGGHGKLGTKRGDSVVAFALPE